MIQVASGLLARAKLDGFSARAYGIQRCVQRVKTWRPSGRSPCAQEDCALGKTRPGTTVHRRPEKPFSACDIERFSRSSEKVGETEGGGAWSPGPASIFHLARARKTREQTRLQGDREGGRPALCSSFMEHTQENRLRVVERIREVRLKGGRPGSVVHRSSVAVQWEHTRGTGARKRSQPYIHSQCECATEPVRHGATTYTRER